MAQRAAPVTGQIEGLLVADGAGFVSRPVETLELVLTGIPGDRHSGATRGADARTPWHPRNVPIANTRQVSLVSREECAELAERLGITEVAPTLLGANVVIVGIPGFGALAPSTRLAFPSGATIFVTETNVPCRQPGRKLAQAYDQGRLEFDFVKFAVGLRGLVGLVEREGAIHLGDAVRVIPPRG